MSPRNRIALGVLLMAIGLLFMAMAVIMSSAIVRGLVL